MYGRGSAKLTERLLATAVPLERKAFGQFFRPPRVQGAKLHLWRFGQTT